MGVEFEGYAADITRTFAVNGVYQRCNALYTRWSGYAALIDMVKPGVTWGEMQHTSERVITQGLVQLGILSGNVASLMRNGSIKHSICTDLVIGWVLMYMMLVAVGDSGRPFEPGMVLTIEPCIYISQGMPGVDPRWQGIGIRIEDDILVTDDGCRVLTKALPKSIEAIEAVMRD